MMIGKTLLLALLAGLAPGSRDPSPGIPPGTCALPDAVGPIEAFHAPLPESAAPVDAPAYYAFPVVSTRRLPGTGLAAGLGEVTFPDSPFGVTLADDGSYVLDVWLSVERLMAPREGVYVGWLTTPDLDKVERIGPLADGGQLHGRAQWNKFLLVVTLELADDPEAAMWTGPVVMRGMSRSGLMHTMAGHGAFEQENCAAYGYD
ncbi:MAG: hypothetical protein OXH08_08370 [Gammaproteobacteria bacterium]|nr:hypothetical protein [Gammaproteobacteria bacterium]MDE0650639.1 hypothetical protein [Gammaproteobacteria bacterium]